MGAADWLRRRARAVTGARAPDDITHRAHALAIRGNEYGYDAFGLGRDHVETAARISAWMYRSYFRAEAFGIEHVPTTGRVLLVSNHSGQLPYDGMVIGAACFLEPAQPRLVRSMIEHFVPTLPFASYLMARWGQIIGTPENCRRLLNADEAILVFPEGARGISKPFSRRYQLETFGLGFMRLALATGTPIVPVAVIGAEEQAPARNLTTVAKLLGVPSFPVVPYPPFVPLVPLPVKYRLHFGAAMTFDGDPDGDDETLTEKVSAVKQRIETLIRIGLEARQHVFW
jgi:1-acyl-sn-glycerol-3-phosphate acyltransferase